MLFSFYVARLHTIQKGNGVDGSSRTLLERCSGQSLTERSHHVADIAAVYTDDTRSRRRQMSKVSKDSVDSQEHGTVLV